MSTIGKLFGPSPFGPLQRHMQQAAQCVTKMGETLRAFEQGRWEDCEMLAEEVSQLEHEADHIKDDIRTHLPKRLFTAVERNRVLEILAIQDNLADTAEDVCVLLTLKQLKMPSGMEGTFRKFCELNIKTFHLALSIIEQLDELIESGFGGAEAEKVRDMVHTVAHAEHEVDVVQRTLLKELYAREAEFSYGEFHLWMCLCSQLGVLSNESENLGHSVEAALELK